MQAQEKAVALDPDYALAWAALADALFWASDQDPAKYPLAQARPKAEAAAEKAIALAPDLPEGWAARGLLRTAVDQDWTGARADMERALALSPSNADALIEYSWLLATLGQLPEAIAALNKATALDPLSSEAWVRLSGFYLGAQRLDLAHKTAERALAISPEQPRALRNLGFAFLLEGRPAQALAAFARLDASTDTGTEAYRLMGEALAHGDLGHGAEAQRALNELIGKPYALETSYQIAQIYAWRGDADSAFAWLGHAYERRDAGLSYLKYDPLLRKVRGDPRFALCSPG